MGSTSEDEYTIEPRDREISGKHPGKTIELINRSLQRFDWPDYVSFVMMLFVCIIVGIFFGYKDHQKNKHKKLQQSERDSQVLDYLVGGRKMQVFPVTMSLVAGGFSAVTLLGTTTEIYVYGTQYCYIGIAMIIMAFVMHHVFLPVFHELQVTSVYEYLQLRFDRRMRLFGSILSTFGDILWMPICIYAPSLAFNQVTGISLYIISPIVIMICVFYTSLGGLKAVIWTDVIQTGVALAALLAVLIKGTYDVGGPRIVIERNIAGGRLEAPSFDPDPTLRHTMWTILIGAPLFYLNFISTVQDSIQRFLSLPTLRDARKAIHGYVAGWFVVNGMLFLIGMVIYATYYRCDPLTTQLAKSKDQLLPLFVMETFADQPGLTGIFIAGIFSAALSSLSSALNALSAITLEDFCKPFRKTPLTKTQVNYIMRGVVLAHGVLSVLLSLTVEHMGTVMQLAMTMASATGAPLFGVFVMGILMPWVDGTGALYGGIMGIVVMFYTCYMAQYGIASGSMKFETKPTSVDDCPYEFAYNTTAGNMEETLEHVGKSFYHMSYLYFTLFGTVVTCVAGTLISYFNKLREGRDRQERTIDPKLLAPWIRGRQKEETVVAFHSVPTDSKRADNNENDTQ
ncbi:sodium-coupled monocarboxylate transporter 1-like [Anopheles ziemanni]|uniref:sodium-coupled monocarboxylate transporter 1-like n=1 Tax=Anopheles coustani TaxID=139045 RepID=UPI0026584FAC|nr:sodium-coupled monocarboxylate transporter 1-like [Anopheles coustani]XP_058169000.1 sodium-coupled monocarboxylate transporter 1-like [Anopheles ziemanni]